MSNSYTTIRRADMAVLAATCPVEDIRRFSVMSFDGRYSYSPDVLLVSLTVKSGDEYTYTGDGDSFAYWQAIGDAMYAKIHAYGRAYDFPVCDDKAAGEYWIVYAPIL